MHLLKCVQSDCPTVITRVVAAPSTFHKNSSSGEIDTARDHAKMQPNSEAKKRHAYPIATTASTGPNASLPNAPLPKKEKPKPLCPHVQQGCVDVQVPASVACRQLGLPERGRFETVPAPFGPIRPPPWLLAPKCNGSEATLSACGALEYGNVETCEFSLRLVCRPVVSL